MMVSVDVMPAQEEVVGNAVMFRANAKARYGLDVPWAWAFAAVPCASCHGLEILSKGYCQDCHEAGLAKEEITA